MPKMDSVLERRFCYFYAWYPKKRGKGDAKKAFLKLNPDDQLFSQIMLSLEQHKKSEDWVKNNGQYIPYPATWIRGERWQDILSVYNPQLHKYSTKVCTVCHRLEDLIPHETLGDICRACWTKEG